MSTRLMISHSTRASAMRLLRSGTEPTPRTIQGAAPARALLSFGGRFSSGAPEIGCGSRVAFQAVEKNFTGAVGDADNYADGRSVRTTCLK